MRHLILTTFATMMAAATVAAGVVYFLDRPTILRVAVPRKSEDSRLIRAFQQAFQEDGKNIRFELVPVNDFAESARALAEGRAELAVVRTDIAMPPKSQTLLTLYREAAILMTPKASKATSVTDLKNLKIGVIKGRVSAPGNSALLQLVMNQYSLDPSTYSIREMSPEEFPKALQKHEIQALFAVGEPDSDFLTQTVKAFPAGEGPPNFIPVNEADLIATHKPWVESLTIAAGTFNGAPLRPAEDFDTLSVSVRLMTMNTLSDVVAANVLRHMFAEERQIALTVPLASSLEEPTTDNGQALPVHPGAVAFIDKSELTFLDRYSDYIYLGGMMLSAVFSCLAFLGSHMGLKMCKQIDKHLAQLLALLKAARDAKDLATLNQIESEIDSIMASALASDRVSGLQGHRASAFTMALEHVRAAINDRRTALRPVESMLALEHKMPLLTSKDLEFS